MAKSEHEEAYAKQLKRIKQFMRRAQQRGYQFIKNIIPKRPQKIKPESVENLKKITPEKMYKKAVYGGEATNGVIVKGTEGKKAENKARSIKSAQTRKARREQEQQIPAPTFSVPDSINEDTSFFDKMVIGEYRRSLKYLPTLAYTLITEWVDRIIGELGEHLVALMLEEGIRNGVILQREEGYHEEKVRNYITEMENYFWVPVDTKADITDALESNENFNAY